LLARASSVTRKGAKKAADKINSILSAAFSVLASLERASKMLALQLKRRHYKKNKNSLTFSCL